jgi:hypothetical protein
MRWLPVGSLLLLLWAPVSRAQSTSKPAPQQNSHKPSSRKRVSHPSHPMRNARPKRHAAGTRKASFQNVRFSVPQQASTTAVSHPASSSHAATSTSKKKKSSKKSRHSRREPSQKAPTPERISEIQSSLARGGYYQGEPNGKWDASTVGAMQKFQSANGLDPSGKLDAPSLQKLGLGSGIAGVSAPRPACCSAAPATGTAPPPAAPKPAPTSSSNSGSDSAANPASAANTSGSKPPQR